MDIGICGYMDIESGPGDLGPGNPGPGPGDLGPGSRTRGPGPRDPDPRPLSLKMDLIVVLLGTSTSSQLV